MIQLHGGNAFTQLIDRLRGYFVARDQLETVVGLNVGTASAAASGQVAASGDVFPVSDARGLMVRVVNRNGNTVTDHFRSGVIPSGYTWQGAPFDGTPASLYYNYASDFLVTVAAGAANRIFLSTAVTNSGAAWQNQSIYARVHTGSSVDTGVRIDDATDNNYVELVMTGALNNGTQRLDLRWRIGGGAVNTLSSAVITSMDTNIVMQLNLNYSGGTYRAYGYFLGEEGLASNPGSFWTAVLAWMPVAGRVGVYVKGNANWAVVDWFYSTFG